MCYQAVVSPAPGAAVKHGHSYGIIQDLREGLPNGSPSTSWEKAEKGARLSFVVYATKETTLPKRSDGTAPLSCCTFATSLVRQ
ncbi:MAG: hypothetical protein AW10_02563 [Candidatus Accumulibacter appositus]|uniref:Uncharacterized protein n=1 Tax=Candidatus Accumulibacter appositus TaxID=1454003 RepID=A0A011PQ70_9PROT|nr:MAG: hypothetical protein AW10_02563 [Candidatus Accumulibacter appositus]